MVDLKQCSVKVTPNTQWGAFQTHQCNNKVVVERDGNPYCRIHDPEYIKQKDAEREAMRKAKGCQTCGRDLKRWWTYCPYCGTKLEILARE